MEKQIKEMVNSCNLQGIIVDNTIEMKVSKKGNKYVGGEIEIETTDGYVVPVRYMANEKKADGAKSKLYDRYLSLINVASVRTSGSEMADRLNIRGARIEDNTFYSTRDQRMISNWRIGGGFTDKVSKDATPINTFEIQGVISKMGPVLNRDGEETGVYEIKLLNVSYGNRIVEVPVRYSEKAAVKYINDNYEVGNLVTINGVIAYEQTETKQTKEVGFGEAITQTYTNTVRVLKVKGGSTPQDPEEAFGVSLKELKVMKEAQDNQIKERTMAQEQKEMSKAPAADVWSALEF